MQTDDQPEETQTEGEYMTIGTEGTYTVNICYACEGTGWVADAYTCPDCTGRGHTIIEADEELL